MLCLPKQKSPATGEHLASSQVLAALARCPHIGIELRAENEPSEAWSACPPALPPWGKKIYETAMIQKRAYLFEQNSRLSTHLKSEHVIFNRNRAEKRDVNQTESVSTSHLQMQSLYACQYVRNYCNCYKMGFNERCNLCGR